MKKTPVVLRLFAVLALLPVLTQPPAVSAGEKPVNLIGAGASFASPLYLRWFRDYHRAHPGVRPDYQSVGSGSGINEFIEGRIDFAGSDLRMSDEQRARVQDGMLEIPGAAGGIVVIYNVPGLTGLELSREALVGIFSGRIERWNDPAIARANPDVALPDDAITLIARADASGTTYHLTRHLSAVSPEFAEQIGATMTPAWPKPLKQRGALIRARGNDGVAALVRAIEGSIGYVQYAYAFLSDAPVASLENRAGRIVAPSNGSFLAAVDAMDAGLTAQAAADPPGDASYPIIALSWLMIHRRYEDPRKLPALLDLIRYGMGPGQAMTEQLGYIRFSDRAVANVLELLTTLE